MKIITLAILNYNTCKLTLETLRSTKDLDVPKEYKLETLLVDNGSTDDSVAQISKVFSDIKIIKSKLNLGFSGGNNLAAKYAVNNKSAYLLLLNSDTIVDKNLLKYLLQLFKEHPKAGIVSPKIYFASGYEFHKDRYKKTEQGKVIWFAGGKMDWENIIGSNQGVDEVDKGQYDQDQVLELTTGCCMLIRRELFTTQTLYDDRYFLYYEDADLCQRCLKSGFEIWYAWQAKIWHVNAGSSGSGSDLHDYFITRNRMLFGMTYASLRTKFALLRESIRLLLNGRKWQKQGILDYYLNRLNRGTFPL